MKMIAFRVQNYKRIEDTGWVDCRDLTVLVGKNEAGKSAVLRGLSKLNPSDGEAYDGLKEFPRRSFSDEYDEERTVASARFELDDGDRLALSDISSLLSQVETVEVGRRYNNVVWVSFRPGVGADTLPAASTRRTVMQALEDLEESFAPDGHGAEYGPLKDALKAELAPLAEQIPQVGAVQAATLQKLYAAVAAKVTEQWHRDALADLLNALRPLHEEAKQRAAFPQARGWVVEQMPRFIYFDRYDVLDSAVHIPTFIVQMQQDAHAPRVRTTRALFDHVGLDPLQLNALGAGQHTDRDEARRRTDERAIRTSAAGQAMTEKFGEWWLQRRHKFRYGIDGDYFRVWVSDDLDPSEIELDQRSQGMQYFFSFFLVFLVEAVGSHKDSVLLLDEPGNSLHGTAQAKIVEFLRKVSEDNQVIYSTHSPFMIDGDHLEEIRPVYEDKSSGSTKVSDDVWPKDKDALFPLQAALGYQLAQSLFISRHQILVEGITDFWILKALDAAMEPTGRTGLADGVIIAPGGGAGRVVPLASMLVGHEVRVAALLDGDQPGRREGQKLERVLGFENRVLFVGDYTHDNNTTGEIEDIFPDDYYMAAVKRAYPGEDVRFNADEKAIDNIVDRCEALFARRGHGAFEKWKVARNISDEILSNPAGVPAEALDAFENMAAALNQVSE